MPCQPITMATSPSPETSNGHSFPFNSFLQDWLLRQQDYLHQLLSAIQTNNEDQLRHLIGRVVMHYQEYYEFKGRVAREDIFRVFSPPWLSSLERTFLWIAGFRPGILFRLVGKSVGNDLSQDQRQKMDVLTLETKVAEADLNYEMVKIQESMVGPELVRGGQQVVEADMAHVNGVLQSKKEMLRIMVSNADYLRATTVTEILSVLNPIQSVKFLAAVAEFQLKVRKWGFEIDG